MIEIVGWAFLGLVVLTFLVGGFRAFLVRKMAESFELGMKLGYAKAFMSQDDIDAMIRNAGIDPTKLPGRDL